MADRLDNKAGPVTLHFPQIPLSMTLAELFAHPQVWWWFLALVLILLTAAAVYQSRRALDQVNRCPRCKRTVQECQPDLTLLQVRCPHCSAVMGHLSKLPLVDGRLLHSREYRFSKTLRVGHAGLVILLCLGLFLLMVFWGSFDGLRLIQLGAGIILIGGILWAWNQRAQLLIASEAGITSKNLFRRRHVRWDEIQRILRLPGGEGPASLGVYTTRTRRWVWPQLTISEAIQDFQELKGIIIVKAGLTPTAKPGLLSLEMYERVTPAEAHTIGSTANELQTTQEAFELSSKRTRLSRRALQLMLGIVLVGLTAASRLIVRQQPDERSKIPSTTEFAQAIVDMAEQPIEVLGLTQDIGFVGILVGFYGTEDGIVWRVKGLFPRSKYPKDLWEDACRRNGVTVFDVPGWLPFVHRKAVVMDCLLSGEEEVAIRRIMPEERLARDLFVRTMQQMSLDSLTKAAIYRDQRGWSVTLASDEDFSEAVRALERKTREFLERAPANNDGPDNEQGTL